MPKTTKTTKTKTTKTRTPKYIRLYNRHAAIGVRSPELFGIVMSYAQMPPMKQRAFARAANKIAKGFGTLLAKAAS